jgi:putative membrane-bound dehydrogenase-like protein
LAEFIIRSKKRDMMLGRKPWISLRFDFLFIFMIIAALTDCGRKGPPYSPKEALQTIKVEKGFRVGLFASEPLIGSPVAMDIDENGRIFVVEMPGYPLDTCPTGRVVMLEDTNGDGRPDRRTVFADQLVFPNGVMRWKKGILVTAAPNVWYFEDTDGDGKADVRRVVLTGFAFTNPQHMVNGLRYGLDNWIYLANAGPAEAIVFKAKFGDLGSDIRFPDRGDVPALKVHNRSVRFHPDTYQLEALSGASQFGHAFDDWGHYFTVDNENQGSHEVIAARYLQRNPDLLVSSAAQDMSDHGNAAKVFPMTQRPEYQLLSGIGTLTSACSLTIYQGGAFSPEYNRVAFVAEPAQNLVHCDVLSDLGSTFVASRLREGVEFLASTDSWFRPVFFYIGPDGALYLMDYYRRLIEHPEWTSSHHHHDSKDLYSGSDRGRIYRVVPDSTTPLELPKDVQLGKASDAELVHQLSNANIWWRRTAQRLLVDRRSNQAGGLLTRLVNEGRSPLGRLHALWTLEGLGKLDDDLVLKALDDPEPGVRENAILLAEPRLLTSPRLVEKLLKLAGDLNPKVRFQLLCTLGFLRSAAAKMVQEKLLIENIEDKWMQAAALSASSDRAPQFFELALSHKTGFTAKKTGGHDTFFRQVCAVIGARQKPGEIKRVLATVIRVPHTGSEWWGAASLEGLARGASGKEKGTHALKGSQDLLLKLFEHPKMAVRRASLELLKVAGLSTGPSADKALKRAEATATDDKADPEARADAIGLLALARTEVQVHLFKKLIDPREPDAVQAAAVKALGQVKGDEVGKFLLGRWRTMTAPVRNEAAYALERDPSRIRLLLNAIKNEEVQSWTLNFSQKRALIMNDDPQIRNMAHALLEDQPGEREKVLKRYEAALDMKGDASRGEQVFKRVCSKCHKKNGVGAEVGPDLGTVQNRPDPLLLEDILVPSKSIAQKYEAYVVETASGGIQEGVLGSQTPTTITLRKEEGKETIIPRIDIRRMYVANLSAMPADLEKHVDVQQMADLLKFLAIR